MIRIELERQLIGADGPMRLSVALDISGGGFLAVNGPSGAGKTSLLRMIAGLMEPENGEIIVEGVTWFSKKGGVMLPTQRRAIGIVFQDHALFPNMTVRGNLKYALPKNADPVIIGELLELTQLERLADAYPATLSGGQKQRVALARALVRQPRLLLLDEPMTALDPAMRLQIQRLLSEAHDRYHLTSIIVSHDVGDIYNLADRVVTMDAGKIVCDGTPDQVFVDPRNSGKFQVTGSVLKIEMEDIVFVVTIQTGNQVVRVVASEADVAGLKTGDAVLVSSKAFNPVLIRLSK